MCVEINTALLLQIANNRMCYCLRGHLLKGYCCFIVQIIFLLFLKFLLLNVSIWLLLRILQCARPYDTISNHRSYLWVKLKERQKDEYQKLSKPRSTWTPNSLIVPSLSKLNTTMSSRFVLCSQQQANWNIRNHSRKLRSCMQANAGQCNSKHEYTP